ncbi:MAG: FG-GAP and VCBS repeat-containing protein [Ginsengibacter sp.]
MIKYNKQTSRGFTAGFILLLFSAPVLLMNAYHPSSVAEAANKEVTFKKIILTTDFLSEGVAVADVNKDGQMDVLAGTFWFEAPDWKRHEIDAGKIYKTVEYSNTFLDFAMDVNYDGWMDLIRIPIPGAAATWYENPKNAPGYWKEHAAFHSVGNESPAFYDIDNDGLPDLVCADSKNKKMVWVSPPPSKNDSSWTRHIISNDSIRGTHMYTHGLGFGDMNNDGRTDVVMREGWWEAPVNRKQENWIFHPANLGDECSQMYIMDLDGDGDMDVISASAHRYGMWWHEQVKAGDSVNWVQHDIYNKFSQTHGVALADINQDGYPDLVTGKRYYAHNGHDPGAEEPAMLYWFEYKPGKVPTWVPHQIDDNSGVGLQVVTHDMNKDNLVDIVESNKKGVYIFLQVK